ALYDFVVSEVFPRQIREYGDSFAADLEAFRRIPERRLVSAGWALNRLKRNFVYKPAVVVWRRTRRRRGSSRPASEPPPSRGWSRRPRGPHRPQSPAASSFSGAASFRSRLRAAPAPS